MDKFMKNARRYRGPGNERPLNTSVDYAPFVGQIGAHNKRVQLRQPVDDWTRVGWYLQVSRTLCKA